jgi:hypothetical protein
VDNHDPWRAAPPASAREAVDDVLSSRELHRPPHVTHPGRLLRGGVDEISGLGAVLRSPEAVAQMDARLAAEQRGAGAAPHPRDPGLRTSSHVPKRVR